MGYYNIENRGKVYGCYVHNKDGNIPVGITVEKGDILSPRWKVGMIYYRGGM